MPDDCRTTVVVPAVVLGRFSDESQTKGAKIVRTLMPDAALSERLEYAILEIVCWNPSQATHQNHWGGWCSLIRRRVPEFSEPQLVAAFRRLWRRGVIRLTKPNSTQREAHDYSGEERDDEWFFSTGPFNVSITDEGRSVWDRAEEPKTTVFISHIAEEKAVALRLQALVLTAFSDAFPVFVSSDPASLGGVRNGITTFLKISPKPRSSSFFSRPTPQRSRGSILRPGLEEARSLRSSLCSSGVCLLMRYSTP